VISSGNFEPTCKSLGTVRMTRLSARVKQREWQLSDR
jgi:hypothetical protein